MCERDSILQSVMRNNIEDPRKSRFLITGFQAENTLARKLVKMAHVIFSASPCGCGPPEIDSLL